MPTPAKIVHFNALPETVRRRFIACTSFKEKPVPVLSDKLGGTGAIIGFLLLGGLAAIGIWLVWSLGYGRYYGSTGRYGVGGLAAFALCGYVLAWSILAAIRRVRLRGALPFAPGRYMFGMDLVDARDARLRIVPMGKLVNFNGVHHYRNGVYMNTSLNFTFEGGEKQVFAIRGREAADNTLRQLQGERDALVDAAQREDFGAVAGMDVFFEARVGGGWDKLPAHNPNTPESRRGPVAGELPGFLRRAGVLALVVGAAAAFPIWQVRNQRSDDEMFRRARGSTWGLKAYLRQGVRHRKEAQELFARVALDEAKKAGSVTALRAFLEEHKDAREELRKEAKDAIHASFEKVLGQFRAQAAVGDPRVLPFVEELVAYLEAKDSPPVVVRFRAPRTEALAEMDAVLQKIAQKEAKMDMAPVAPHFQDSSALPRETAIVKGLERGFAAVFPADIMSLEQGARLGDADAGKELANPTIEVSYEVGPKLNKEGEPSIYQGERSQRLFVGITVSFAVSVKIPGGKAPYELAFAVKPPGEFTVETYRSPYAAPGSDDEMPPDARVYQIMTDRAFDELQAKLKAAFFKPGSKAFGEPDVAEGGAPGLGE